MQCLLLFFGLYNNKYFIIKLFFKVQLHFEIKNVLSQRSKKQNKTLCCA